MLPITFYKNLKHLLKRGPLYLPAKNGAINIGHDGETNTSGKMNPLVAFVHKNMHPLPGQKLA